MTGRSCQGSPRQLMSKRAKARMRTNPQGGLLERETNRDFPEVQKGKQPSMDTRHHGHVTLEVLWRNCRRPTSLSYQYFKHIEMSQEQAHTKNNVYKNNLLLSIRQYISAFHKAERKSNVQCSTINQWRVPDWA